MRDEADVGLVHAHPEGVGGHDDVYPAREEALLGLAALLIRKPGVVHAGAQAHAGEHAPPELDGLSRRGVHDARQPHLAHESLQDQALLLSPATALDGEREVGALEARHQLQRRPQAELIGDVGTHLGRGGGGESGRRHGQLRAEAREPAVVGPEVVSPLADAVGLVHDEAGGPGLRQGGTETVMPEALRRHVDQLEMASRQGPLGLLALGGGHAGVERGGGEAPRPEGIHLVLHERDERGDDDGGTIQQQRGKLEAERLAGTRGHDCDNVAAFEHCQRDLPLAWAEARHAEALVQRTLQHFDTWQGCRGHGAKANGGAAPAGAAPPLLGAAKREPAVRLVWLEIRAQGVKPISPGEQAKSPADRSRSGEVGFRRAGDRTRTGDVQLGKLAFYH